MQRLYILMVFFYCLHGIGEKKYIDQYNITVLLQRTFIWKCVLYRIVETFEGKNIHKFCGFRATCKSFLHEIWVCCTHLCYVITFHESFLHEMVTFTNLQKFSPSKVSHYNMVYEEYTTRLSIILRQKY